MRVYFDASDFTTSIVIFGAVPKQKSSAPRFPGTLALLERPYRLVSDLVSVSYPCAKPAPLGGANSAEKGDFRVWTRTESTALSQNGQWFQRHPHIWQYCAISDRGYA